MNSYEFTPAGPVDLGPVLAWGTSAYAESGAWRVQGGGAMPRDAVSSRRGGRVPSAVAAVLVSGLVALLLAVVPAHAATPRPVHAGPYTLSTGVVRTPAHGFAAEVVTFRGSLLDCRSARPVHVWLDAVNGDGGEESDPAVFRHGRWVVRLWFRRSDAPSWWVLDAVTYGCSGQPGWGAFDGAHPWFRVAS